MLGMSFGIIFTLKKTGDEYKNRYGKKGCEDYNKLYTKDGKGEEILNEEAYKTFYTLAENENLFIRE
jgi:hypothetical protein